MKHAYYKETINWIFIETHLLPSVANKIYLMLQGMCGALIHC